MSKSIGVQGRCRNLDLRCHVLLSALSDDDGNLPSAAHADALSEAEATLLIVRDKVNEWTMLNTMQSLLRQDDIREGIDELQKRVDICIAACQVRISRQMAQALKEHSEQSQQDMLEIRLTMQQFLVAFTKYVKNPNTLPNDPTFRAVVQDIEEEAHSIQSEAVGMGRSTNSVVPDNNSLHSSDSQNQTFSDAIREFGRSVVNLELTHHSANILNPRDTNPRHPSKQPAKPTLSMESLTSAARRVSRLWSPPQIPPLDFGEKTFWLPGPDQFIYTEPLPGSGGSAVHFGQTLADRRMSIGVGQSTRGSSIDRQTERSSILCDLTAPRPLSPLDVALTTRVGVWKTSGQQPGVITTATVEGLIHYLLLTSGEKDKRERDIFFIAHPAFMSSSYVLELLFRRYEEAWVYSDEMRNQIRQRVVYLINSWLRNPHVIFAVDDLAELRKFILKVNQLKTLDELVVEAVQGINEKELLLNLPPSPIISSFDSTIGTGPTPRQLAIALARLEGERYQCILPVEYISHAGKLHSFSPNLTAAISLNQRISNWVKSSILDMDLDGVLNEVERRCATKRFFVQTAKECHAICNFASLGAIMGALQSTAISSLTLTHKRMLPKERHQYQKLVNFLKSDSNYHAYKEALSKVGPRGCIPWHVVHIYDIRYVMQNEKDVDEQHHPPLINFQKWAHLKEKAMSASQYRDVPFKSDKQDLQMAMGYLMKGLQDIRVGEDFSRDLETNSEKLVKNEILLATGRDDVRDANNLVGFG